MKFLIASDLHGSSYYAQKILDIFNAERADKLVLLGDIYNHGPRNALPKDYNPMEVARILNSVKDKLLVIKGNCDSQVDTMISEFSFIEDAVIVSGEKAFYLTHGHVYNKDNMPATKFDGIIYGHFHTGFIEQKEGVIIANVGSLSIPKNNTPSSYLILENGHLTLKDEQGNIIKG